MGKYHMFNRPHGMIGGMMNKPAAMANVPPHWGIYFRVSDINAAVERIKSERRHGSSTGRWRFPAATGW